MSSKKKLVVSMLVLAFVLLSILAAVAVIFALTQQTIKTSLNIGYTVEDIDGSVSATFTMGGVTEKLTAKKGAQEIGEELVFKVGDTESAGNLVLPEDAIALTAKHDNVVIQYTYSNTGIKHYIASMSFDANIDAVNMKVEYSIDGSNYSDQRYAVVVPANTSNKSYWIKISIVNKAKDARFKGNFKWLLNGCDPQDKAYLSLSAVDFIGENGTYSASINGEGEYLPQVVFPSDVNGDPVTTIAQSSNLTNAQKQQVVSVYVPDSVTTIETSAFEGFTNLKKVTFEQNEAAGVSAQSNSGLTTIGANAFKDCLKLDNLIIPNTVTSCNTSAFANCASLKNVTINTMNSEVLSVVKDLANANNKMNLTIGEGVTSIGDSVFEGCTGLRGITIPSTVTTCSTTAFTNCPNLKNITTQTLSSNVATIIKNLANENSDMVLFIKRTYSQEYLIIECKNT